MIALPIPLFLLGIPLLIYALFIYTHIFKEHNSSIKQGLHVTSWCTEPLYSHSLQCIWRMQNTHKNEIHTQPSVMVSTYGVNLDERMLDKTLCVFDTKFMNLRTYHFTSWLYYFCWNSLTAWWFMPCHLYTAISTSIVLDSGISCSAVTMPVNKTLIINAQCNPMWFIYKNL